MNNAIEKVSPSEFDGIEFYCSANGEETGMSHRGLFKFVGIPRTTGRRLIGVLGELGQNKFPESLERWNTVSIFHENISGVNDNSGAQCGRILKSEFCADFCSYIAYEYNGGNKIARHSLNKFATIGIKTFIQELTGHKTVSSSSDMITILNLLQSMDTRMGKMEKQLNATAGYRSAKVFYPGLEFVDSDETIPDDTICLPESDHSWYTIKEALAEIFPGHVFPKNNNVSLGIMVAASWKSLKQELPTKVIRVNDRGTRSAPVAAYPASFLPLIKADVIKFLMLN